MPRKKGISFGKASDVSREAEPWVSFSSGGEGVSNLDGRAALGECMPGTERSGGGSAGGGGGGPMRRRCSFIKSWNVIFCTQL